MYVDLFLAGGVWYIQVQSHEYYGEDGRCSGDYIRLWFVCRGNLRVCSAKGLVSQSELFSKCSCIW
jgi:hypothetical protein